MFELTIRKNENDYTIHNVPHRGMIGRVWVAETTDKLLEVIADLCEKLPDTTTVSEGKAKE